MSDITLTRESDRLSCRRLRYHLLLAIDTRGGYNEIKSSILFSNPWFVVLLENFLFISAGVSLENACTVDGTHKVDD